MKIQFSIRELLLIIVIAALAVGWWLDHARIQEERANLARMKVELLEQQKAALRRYINENGVHITPTPQSLTIPILRDLNRL
jgi:hypothetical protein